MGKSENPFIGYEYMQINVPDEQSSMYMDCYENFGWELDKKILMPTESHMVTICMKRNRKIINKMELTRLQRHFEACMREINVLEQAKNSAAMVSALTIGIIGAVFMTGSVFAATHVPPHILLCIVLAIPALLGCLAPYFIYCHVLKWKAEKMQPLIEAKKDEIYQICEKGHSLL